MTFEDCKVSKRMTANVHVQSSCIILRKMIISYFQSAAFGIPRFVIT